MNSAAAMKADLLVMGTHGLGGFHRLLLGSVTEKVARTASCPLLTVPPAAPAMTPRPILFKKIVCPIDYSPASLKALDYALELGRQADGRARAGCTSGSLGTAPIGCLRHSPCAATCPVLTVRG